MKLAANSGITKEFTMSVLINLSERPTIRTWASPKSRAVRQKKVDIVPRLMITLGRRGGDTLESSESVAPSRDMSPAKVIVKPTAYCTIPNFQS